VQMGMERLRDISEEVESIQQNTEPLDSGTMIVVPDPPSKPPVVDTTSPPRSASTLLKDPESSVFRIPTKKGDLFESAGGK